ncbi:uncharacterized protein IWZ02DRAFT_266881 [Phyllosticta citriasiana]|uniref:uncharacterized protein n=1 Tax=Phyllosticta citriasiana TaxID=595635 RepID=UPI0030FD2C23
MTESREPGRPPVPSLHDLSSPPPPPPPPPPPYHVSSSTRKDSSQQLHQPPTPDASHHVDRTNIQDLFDSRNSIEPVPARRRAEFLELGTDQRRACFSPRSLQIAVFTTLSLSLIVATLLTIFLPSRHRQMVGSALMLFTHFATVAHVAFVRLPRSKLTFFVHGLSAACIGLGTALTFLRQVNFLALTT